MFGTCVQEARAVTHQTVSSSDNQADRWVTRFFEPQKLCSSQDMRYAAAILCPAKPERDPPGAAALVTKLEVQSCLVWSGVYAC
jgi:hypothetical protein